MQRYRKPQALCVYACVCGWVGVLQVKPQSKDDEGRKVWYVL